MTEKHVMVMVLLEQAEPLMSAVGVAIRTEVNSLSSTLEAGTLAENETYP